MHLGACDGVGWSSGRLGRRAGVSFSRLVFAIPSLPRPQRVQKQRRQPLFFFGRVLSTLQRGVFKCTIALGVVGLPRLLLPCSKKNSKYSTGHWPPPKKRKKNLRAVQKLRKVECCAAAWCATSPRVSGTGNGCFICAWW